ncbi:response regulator [Cohnella fermenti]|uniref:Response regulator n=1 Tax=Cohnella fermenti TaxID=2565925 RepID=A0A4S4BP54_9BACL|nr:response regulator [Cohnella fermenti]THF76678.1 response regulator [Cohnella fermenti]
MFKVMLVEDEMLVRIGFKNAVDWNRFGMEVAWDVPDGLAAWEVYGRERPDLIITDIKMPRMDGMELISRIREQDKSTRIVVLSCLEEFDLVRKAMALGVSNYILKLTMTDEEIEAVLSGVEGELLARAQRSAESKGIRTLADTELLKEKMLKDFLFYGIRKAEEFERFVQVHRLALSPERMIVGVMEIDRYAQLRSKFKDDHGHLVKMTIQNLLTEIVGQFNRGEAAALEDKSYLLVLHYGDVVSEMSIRRELHGLLQQIRQVMKSYFNTSVSFGVSSLSNGYASLPRLLEEARRVVQNRFLSGPGLIHVNSEPVDTSELLEQLACLRQLGPLRGLLPASGIEAYEGFVQTLTSSLHEQPETVRVLVYQLVQWIHTKLYEYNHNEITLLRGIPEGLEQCDTLPEMLDLIERHVRELAEEARSRLQMSPEIIKAVQFIKLHYQENISLLRVARKVGLSSGYLSNLFKKELGMTFIDYLNRYRVERAKELLIMTSKKSYDIAVEVGFSPEYTYFSKVFKRLTGLNPNEYRRQAHDGDIGI